MLRIIQHVHQLVDCVFAVAGGRLDILSQYVLSLLDRIRHAFCGFIRGYSTNRLGKRL